MVWRVPVFALLLVLAAIGPASAQESLTGVASVIDGDTIEIHGQRIRFNPAVGEQEHESNKRKPPLHKPLVSRILCAFKCRYHRFRRPSKNGETENKKNERIMMARWKGRFASDQNARAKIR